MIEEFEDLPEDKEVLFVGLCFYLVNAIINYNKRHAK